MDEQLKKWAKERGLNDEQREAIQRTLDTAKIMVSRPLITYLKELVEYKVKYDDGVDRAKAKRLLKALDKLPVSDHTGFIDIEFKDDKDRLRMQVSLTNRNHEILLKDAPYLKNVYMQLDKMVNMVLTYYQAMMRDKELKDLMLAVIGDDAGLLTLNKFDTTMYLSDPFEKRLGILCFYVDQSGKPIEWGKSDEEREAEKAKTEVKTEDANAELTEKMAKLKTE